MQKKASLVLLSALLAACSGGDDATQASAEQAKPARVEPASAQPANSQPASVEQAADDYQPIPPGYGYMEEGSALEYAIKERDRATLREHAWKLWAGIMQPAVGSDWPLWTTWPNSYGAFQSSPSEQLGDSPATDAKLNAASMRKINAARVIVDKEKTPVYPIPEAVKRAYPDAVCGEDTLCDGPHFVNNGDIMIANEAFSREAMDWIRGDKLYLKSTLDREFAEGVHQLEAPQRHIVTKHMYWPVLAGQHSAIPVWNEDYGPEYTGYAGYETWKTLVAVDPSGQDVGKTQAVSYLHGVLEADGKTPMKPVTGEAKVVALDDFYYKQVSEADWAAFTDADKAIINAASYWAYNKPFGPGDYLVSIAMHINTKEVPTWALQSVWWSDRANEGKYAEDRPSLPAAQGPWWNYLMVESYGIPEADGSQPVAMNPYIELVIHPVATNCNTCHMRAGWPLSPFSSPEIGKASYQNPDCPSLVATLSPQSACLEPLTLTDFQWTIPDRAK